MNSFASYFRHSLLILVSVLAIGNVHALTFNGFNSKSTNDCYGSTIASWGAFQTDGTSVDSTDCGGSENVKNGNPEYGFSQPAQLCPIANQCNTLTFSWTASVHVRWGSGNSHGTLQFCVPNTTHCFYYAMPGSTAGPDVIGGWPSSTPTTDSYTQYKIVTINPNGDHNCSGENCYGNPSQSTNSAGDIIYTYTINSIQFHRALDLLGYGYTADQWYLRNYHINNEATHTPYVDGGIFVTNYNASLTIQ